MNPLIFLPNHDKGESTKALQLYVDNNPHIVICPGNIFHHESLRELLERETIPFETQSFGRDGYGPKQKGDRYELVGAGSAIVTQDSIILYYKSRGYNIGINQEHAERIIPLIRNIEISWNIW